MCHWNTVNWNCIIRKETLEEKLSEEEKHALSRLQKNCQSRKKWNFFLQMLIWKRYHIFPERTSCKAGGMYAACNRTGRSGMGEKGCRF